MRTFKKFVLEITGRLEEEPTSEDPKDPRSRLDGTDALVRTYKNDTPGQKKSGRKRGGKVTSQTQ